MWYRSPRHQDQAAPHARHNRLRGLGARYAAVFFLSLTLPTGLLAEDMMLERFEAQPSERWRFFSDQVMGGVSTGQVEFLSDAEAAFARMTGSVSTENNGGFIQMRTDLPRGAPDGTNGVRLVVRGNGERYFVHLRTAGTRLPWQYYQAGFDVTGDWREIRLPFESFAASGGLLPATPRAGRLRSVGVVAFGRDHNALIEVREIGFY